MKTNEKILKTEIETLLKRGYSYKDIENAIKYIENNERLLELANTKGWKYISEHEKLPIEFIRKYKNNLSWDNISLYQKLTSEQIEEFADYVNWFIIFMKYDDLPSYMYSRYQRNIRKAIYDTQYKPKIKE